MGKPLTVSNSHPSVLATIRQIALGGRELVPFLFLSLCAVRVGASHCSTTWPRLVRPWASHPPSHSMVFALVKWRNYNLQRGLEWD